MKNSWFSSVGVWFVRYISLLSLLMNPWWRHPWIHGSFLCFCRKAQYRRIGSMSLPGAVSPSSPERSVSRDSMEDYWSEMKNIQEDCQERHEELTERASVDGAYRRSVLSSWAAFPPSGCTEQLSKESGGKAAIHSPSCLKPVWMTFLHETQKVMFSKLIMWLVFIQW